MSFNSTLVRLQPLAERTGKYAGTEFQFHIGPITTIQVGIDGLRALAFQFHIGPITTDNQEG